MNKFSSIKKHLNSKNELGISTSKLEFNPKASQKEFAHYVENKADHIPETGYAVGNPKDFEWEFKPEFPLHELTPIKSDWKSWYQGEISEWVHDHGSEERAGHFEKWAKEPEKKPPIVMQGYDNKLHIWDGHHRVAMAHIKNMDTIPVLYGKRKK